MKYEECTTLVDNPIIVVEENKSKMSILNKSRKKIRRICVDGCLIGDDQEKCDWLIATVDAPLKAIYVELKGCNIDKAVSQLKSTLRLTKEHFSEHSKECYIVSTRVPKAGVDIRRISIAFHREMQATLSIKNICNSVDI